MSTEKHKRFSWHSVMVNIRFLKIFIRMFLYLEGIKKKQLIAGGKIYIHA